MASREQLLRAIQPRRLDTSLGNGPLPIATLQQTKNGEPLLVIQAVTQTPFRAVFDGMDTPSLYNLREFLDSIISNRPDSKR